MREAKSLTGILRDRSRIQGDALAFRFLADGTAEGAIDWSYRELAEAREAVLSAVAAEHAVRLSALHLGPPGTVFTTTSGKVCRGATRQAYMAGALKSLGPASPADAFLVPGALGAPGGTGGNNQ